MAASSCEDQLIDELKSDQIRSIKKFLEPYLSGVEAHHLCPNANLQPLFDPPHRSKLAPAMPRARPVGGKWALPPAATNSTYQLVVHITGKYGRPRNRARPLYPSPWSVWMLNGPERLDGRLHARLFGTGCVHINGQSADPLLPVRLVH